MRSKHKLLISAGVLGLLLLSALAIYMVVALVAPELFFKSYQTSPSTEEQVYLPNPSAQPTQTFADQVKVLSSEKVKTLHQPDIDQAQSSYWKTTLTTAAPTIDVYKVEVSVPRQDNEPENTVIKAQVFVPQTSTQLPTVVYGSGTTGISPKCAPSLEDITRSNIGNYFNQMAALSSLGYVVIFPDYEGYATPNGSHSYFIAEQEARALVSSLIATHDVLDVAYDQNPINSAQVFYMGYSQGGHAALAAAASENLLPQTFEVQGVVGFAPALDLRGLLLDSPRLAPYFVYAYQRHYNFNLQQLSSILAPNWINSLEQDVLTHCVDTVYSYYPEAATLIYAPEFLSALSANTLATITPEFAHYLDLNQGTKLQTNTPMFIIQGQQDPIVTPKTQLSAMKELCQNNVPITYTSLAQANHYQTPVQGAYLAHQWMQNALEGSVPNDCASYLSE